MSVVTRSLGPIRASDPMGLIKHEKDARRDATAPTIGFVHFVQFEINLAAPYYAYKPKMRPGCEPRTFDVGQSTIGEVIGHSKICK